MLINKLDNVEVDISSGHKYALTDIPAGSDIIKYGSPIGHATVDIAKGEPIVKYGEHIGVAACDIHVGDHVHTHNVADHREDLKV